MRYTPYGRPITTFNVGAHRIRNTYNGERSSDIEWVNVEALSNLSDICKRYLLNDSLVII
jgi:single-stranded DNA-binding protein